MIERLNTIIMLPFFSSKGDASTKVSSKQQQKKQINIRWNSGIFFQVGLLVSLITMLVIVETEWELSTEMAYKAPKELDFTEFVLENYVLEQPVVEVVEPVAPPERKTIVPVIPETFTPVDNSSVLKETKVESSETPVVEVPKVDKPKKELPVLPTSLERVEWVPTFPGCEHLDSNEARKKCLSKKINKFIVRKFDVDRFADHYDSGKPYKIYAQFTIDADGRVVDIYTRGPGPDLEEEAREVLSKLPTMDPGRMQNRTVPVIFQVPIVLSFSN